SDRRIYRERKKLSCLQLSFLNSGGANRDRTDDLLNAIQALSQLSYGPFSADTPAAGSEPRPKPVQIQVKHAAPSKSDVVVRLRGTDNAGEIVLVLIIIGQIDRIRIDQVIIEIRIEIIIIELVIEQVAGLLFESRRLLGGLRRGRTYRTPRLQQPLGRMFRSARRTNNRRFLHIVKWFTATTASMLFAPFRLCHGHLAFLQAPCPLKWRQRLTFEGGELPE